MYTLSILKVPFLEVYFKYISTALQKYTSGILYKKIMAPFLGSFVSVDDFMDRVELLVGNRVTVRTYF